MIPTHKLKRTLPEWAEVVKTINNVQIYNINILQNILSWTAGIPHVAAVDYYGTVVTYGELFEKVREYVNGFKAIGIKENEVVTICLPVSIENVLTLFATNCMGVINNSPNFLFLKNDFKTYTFEKKSKTLVILDAYLPSVIDYLSESEIEKVIVTSLDYYLPNEKKDMFKDTSILPDKLREIFEDTDKQRDCFEKMAKLRNIKFIPMSEVIDLGKQNDLPLILGPVDVTRDISYSYTSGTTAGKPKCIVYKEESANALIELHIGVNTKDYVGERCFSVIPLTHATGERFCGYLQMARGKTLVPQPIYNKDTFGVDLMNSKCNWITAAPSFYLAGVAQGFIDSKAFENVTRPSSGGEPVTKSNVILIDKWLKMNGCPVRFSIGGGAAEDGSSTICSYFMDEDTKTNETGHPVEPGIIAKIVDENGNRVIDGQRGFLHVSSAAAADRYLDDDEATNKRWYYDADNIRWGITGDIAVKNGDGSYNILGRSDDSYVDKEGERHYLFDIEYSLDEDDPVIEWEISVFKDAEENNQVVAQIVLKPEFIGNEIQVIENLISKYNLYAVKIYEKFESSEVTGKRDFILLKSDKEGYYRVENSKLIQFDFR